MLDAELSVGCTVWYANLLLATLGKHLPKLLLQLPAVANDRLLNAELFRAHCIW